MDATGRDVLFSDGLVRGYVEADTRFVERSWLAQLVADNLDDPGCRFLLLTGEPGAGKSALMAWLARRNARSLRYFIRRDSQVPLNSGDARSLLFALGHQLAALHPELFRPDKLEVVVRQQIGEIGRGARAVGLRVDDLEVSPFYATALRVEQEAALVFGELAGMSVGRLVAEERFLEIPNLQYLALLDPAEVLLQEQPEERIVILVDALDELRYQPRADSALDWLASCPELPANVRFVLTSRPDQRLLERFRLRQRKRLREVAIDADRDAVEGDLHRYARSFVSEPPIADALGGADIPREGFVTGAVAHAEGNFQYLGSLFRAIEYAVAARGNSEAGALRGSDDQLLRLLHLEAVPAGLADLYGFFLSLVRDVAEHVEVLGPALGDHHRMPAWEGLYQPILGILAVAREPLTPAQIRRFAAIDVGERWFTSALARLDQFLERDGERYRLYHATFPEYLTGVDTRTRRPADYFDPKEWHRTITASALAAYGNDWLACDDNYVLVHTPAHLFDAEERIALRTLLHTFEWLQAKLDTVGVTLLITDYDLLPEDSTSKLVQGAIRLSTDILGRSKAQLPAQLIGRLAPNDDPAIKAMLSAAASLAPRPWLRPMHATLSAPGGALLRTYRHESRVDGLAVSADGQRMVTAELDHALTLWDLKTGEAVRTLVGHDDWVNDVALTPDGRQALSASSNLKLWDLRTGEVLRTLGEEDGRVYAVAISADGRLAASGSNFGSLRVWDLASGEQLWAASTSWIHAVAFSTDGGLVVSAGDYARIEVWDSATGDLHRTMMHHRSKVNDLALTRDGRRALSASEDGTLIVWDLARGTALHTLKGHEGPVNSVVLLPDGRRALSGSADGSIIVWDLLAARKERTLGLNRRPIYALGVADGRYVLSSWPLRQWDLDAPAAPSTREEHPEGVRAVTVTADGLGAISCCRTPLVKQWSVDTGGEVARYAISHENVTIAAIAADGHRVLTGSGYGDLRCTDIVADEVVATVGGAGFVRAIALSQAGDVAVGTYRWVFHAWDLSANESLLTVESDTHMAYAAALTPHAHFLLLGYDDCSLEFWDVEAREAIWRLTGHANAISTVALTPDHRVATSGSYDGSMIVWDLQTGRRIAELNAQNEIACMAVTPDGRFLVCGCDDGSVQLWNTELGERIGIFVTDDTIKACAITGDGTRVVVGDEGGRVHFAELMQ